MLHFVAGDRNQLKRYQVASAFGQERPRPGRRGPSPSAAQTYYRRKLSEGKSPMEALRCLKRRLSDAVNRSVLADQRGGSVTSS